MGCACGGDHVFLDHDRPEIVRPGREADLGYGLAHGEPGGLDVFDVGEHDPTDGDHADIFFGRGQVLHAADPGQQGIHVLEGPGDKGQEALGIGRFAALYLADFHQVFKAFFQGFHVAEHHRGRGGDMLLVGFGHDIEPFLGPALALADEATDPVHQDFGAGAGQGVEPRFLEGFENFAVGGFLQLGDMSNLGRSEGVEADIREFGLDGAEGIYIKLQAQFRVVAALEQELVAPVFQGFGDFLPVGGHVRDIGFGMAGDAVEIAKLAVGHADIGGVDVPVDLPGHFTMRHLLAAQGIGHGHQVRQRSVGKEVLAFFSGEKGKIKGFAIQIGQAMHDQGLFKRSKVQ